MFLKILTIFTAVQLWSMILHQTNYLFCSDILSLNLGFCLSKNINLNSNCVLDRANCPWILEKKHGFTKMAVSPLIMVRFSKFKIWHPQGFGADLSDVTVTSHATRQPRKCPRLPGSVLKMCVLCVWLYYFFREPFAHYLSICWCQPKTDFLSSCRTMTPSPMQNPVALAPFS